LFYFRPSRSRKAYDYNTSSSSSSEDAQKKFGNAKGISSDQYFGGRDTDVSFHMILITM
jgi:hypothetical protein